MKSLPDIKTKRTLVNAILSLVENETKGFFKDCDWSAVRNVKEKLANNGASITDIKTEYFHDKETGETQGKRFFFYVSNGSISIPFVLVATFADSQAQRYDICFYPTE